MKSAVLFVSVMFSVAWLSASTSKSDEPKRASKPSADSMRGKKAGDEREDNVLKLKLLWCPPGTFTMGSPKSEEERNNDREDQVDVILSSGFWLGKTEVTQSQWTRQMVTKPWKDKSNVEEGAENAASYISWRDATEAQWEYACRAGNTEAYSFGNDASKLGDYGWWGAIWGKGNAQGELYAHRVGLKKTESMGPS